ncbi:hypothetical protein BAU15_09605 [Enterococcus sp. JM4C]|uniref:M20 family metallopeptidase n=1 Tax=Candidatus Enterococcus huntleyi TaxID=1857217 RepID=UPI00137A1E12|nr:M20 family metallopeptidase [Enterococcus sp. JM4C]KAF1298094.1 hypothetical protein BAU15_09605 [Enterococcus sp. JM4C]
MKQFVKKEHQAAAIEAIKELVRIPSILDESDAGKGHPFGKNVVAALDKVLEISEELGFKTFKDPEGYYGYAEVGEGQELFGILCHLDVVPAGDLKNWHSDPFEPVLTDKGLIGRGVQDDKGPTIASLYAVKSLMDEGVTFNKRVRFIFGTDEENLWRCLDKYNEKEEPITLGFAPDSKFPLIYAEKGLLQAYLVGPGSQEVAVNLPGTMNVVPEVAKYSGDKLAEVKEQLKALNFDFEEAGEAITVIGKSTHSKEAPKGINAITRLAMALSEIVDFAPLNFLGKLVQENATGETVVGKIEDEQSGELTMNFASLTITPTETRIGVDMRMPVTVEKAELVEKLTAKAAEYDLRYEEYDFIHSLYVPLDSELVQNLMSTYRDITGDLVSEPIVSGGATFARTMNQCVAFGAILPDVAGMAHQPDEAWSLESIYKAMDIYAEAVYRLCV